MPANPLNKIKSMFDKLHYTDGNTVTILEPDSQATLNKIRICFQDSAVVAIQFDRLKHGDLFSTSITAEDGIKSACDAIIFFIHNESVCVLSCDLKSTPSASDHECGYAQLLSADCFVDYVLSIIKKMFCKDALNDKFVRINRYFVIFHPPFPFGKTGVSIPQRPLSSADNPRKIPVQNGASLDIAKLIQ